VDQRRTLCGVKDLERTPVATRLPPSWSPETKAKKNASTMPNVTRNCSTRSPEKEAESIELTKKKNPDPLAHFFLLYALRSMLLLSKGYAT
jgi:hypothetical protein